jgi:hypothetical protein
MENLCKTVFFLFILFYSCEKETEINMSLVLTGEVTDINNEGAKFNGEISNISGEEILEYGFVWDIVKNPKIENAQKYIVYDSPKKSTFQTQVSTTLKDSINYFVRAFIKSKTSVIYGNEVIFNSRGSVAPKIKTLFPESGNINDTIQIIGENFSYRNSDNKVFFGEYPSSVIKARQDTLWVVVPSQVNSLNSVVSVSILDNKSIADDIFNLIPPLISDFHEKIGTFGSELTITGENFKSNAESLKVFFGNYAAKIIELNNQSLVVVVPDSLNYRNSSIKVEMNNISALSNEEFILEDLKVKDFNPKVALTGQKITLFGNNFSPVKGNNKVLIGGIVAQVENASLYELEVIVPTQEENYYPSRNVNVKVTVAGQSQDHNEPLLINDKWFRLKDAPVQDPYNLIYVSHDNMVYLGLNNTTELWSFNTQTEKWQQLAHFPGRPRAGGTAFILDKKIYFGTGSINYEQPNDIWEYDINNNTWTQKNKYPGAIRSAATAFSLNNKGYLIAGVEEAPASYNNPYDDCWEYNPQTDSWTELQSVQYPGWTSATGFFYAAAISIGKTALFGLGMNMVAYPKGYHERMYIFDPNASKQWTQIASFPEERTDHPISFLFNGVPVFYASKTFFTYNIKMDTWSPLFESIFNSEEFHYGLAFTSERKIFLGCGRTNQFWEYDQSRE